MSLVELVSFVYGADKAWGIAMVHAWKADGYRRGGPHVRRFFHRFGGPGRRHARERRTRTVLRRSAQRRARRAKVVHRAMGRDIQRYGLIGALVRIVGDAGLTMTLNGVPVSEQGLRAYALESVVDRLIGEGK